MIFNHLLSITINSTNDVYAPMACNPETQDAIGCDHTDCYCKYCDTYSHSCDYDSCNVDTCTYIYHDTKPCARRDHCYIDNSPCARHDDCIYDNECGPLDTEGQPCPPIG